LVQLTESLICLQQFILQMLLRLSSVSVNQYLFVISSLSDLSFLVTYETSRVVNADIIVI